MMAHLEPSILPHYLIGTETEVRVVPFLSWPSQGQFQVVDCGAVVMNTVSGSPAVADSVARISPA
jgi:hypothetical protein